MNKVLDIKGKLSNGVVESLISAFIFMLPNFLLIYPPLKDKIHLFILYNYAVVFIVISIMGNFRFRIR